MSLSDLDARWIPHASLPACAGCSALAGDIERMKTEGKRVSLKRFKFLSSQVESQESLPTFEVDIVGDEVAAQMIDTHGAVIRELKAHRSWIRFQVAWTADGWRVASMLAVNP